MIKKHILILPYLIIFSHINALTLKEAVLDALKSNESIQQLSHQINQDALKIQIEKQKLYPTISLKGSSEKSIDETKHQASINLNWTTLFGTSIEASINQDNKQQIGISQPLLKDNLPYIQFLSLQASQDQLASSYLNLTKLKHEVISKTFRLYYDLYLQKQSVKLKKEAFKTAQKHWNNAQLKYQKGAISKIELYDVKAFYLQQKLDLKNTLNAYKQAKNNLAYHTHQNPKSLSISPKLKPITLSKLKHFSMPKLTTIQSSHPEILNMKKDLKSLKLNLARIKHNQSTELNLTSSINNQGQRSMGININIPLQKDLDRTLNLTKAKFEIQQHRAKIHDSSHKLYTSISNQYQNIVSLQQRIEISKLEEESLKLKNKASQIKFKNGQLSYTKLTDSYQDIYKKRSQNQALNLELVKSIVDYYSLTFHLNEMWIKLLI